MAQNLHDQHYRQLFSSPHMVRALFDGILPANLRQQLDLSTLQPLPSHFVSSKRFDRMADCIWQVRRHDGEALYLLILLEHQSHPDALMSVRVMGYTALLYECLVRYGKFSPSHRLPAILPVVLYSGRRRWRAATQVADLLEVPPAGLEPYQPNMRYLLLDGGALVREGGLPDNNLAALLFRLEHDNSIEPAANLMQTILRLTEEPEFEEVRRVFNSWIQHILLPRHLPQLATEFQQAKDLSETISMLATYKNWEDELRLKSRYEGLKEGREAGRQEGRQEGREAGRQETALDTLTMLITHKFGALPDWARLRLQQADNAALQRWTLNVLDAKRMEDVFADQE